MHKLTKNEADILIQKLSKLDISHVSFSYQDGPKEIVWRYGSEALSVKKKGIDWSISTWIRTEDFVDTSIAPLRNFTRTASLSFSRFPIMARIRLMRAVVTFERKAEAHFESVRKMKEYASARMLIEGMTGNADG